MTLPAEPRNDAYARNHFTGRNNMTDEKREANATCNACGYRGVRTQRGKWCPACWEDEGGELILDADGSAS